MAFQTMELTFCNDELLEFMSFPEVNIPVSPNAQEINKEEVLVNPLQNVAPQRIDEDLEKTYATLDNVNPFILYQPEPVNDTSVSPVATPADERIVNVAAPPAFSRNNEAPSQSARGSKPRSVRYLNQRVNATLSLKRVSTAVQPPAVTTSTNSIPKQLFAFTAAQASTSPSGKKTGRGNSKTGKQKFLWQVTQKFDDPKKEKSRLDAIKAHINRMKDKESKCEVKIKLNDALKELSELKAKNEKQAVDENNGELKTKLNDALNKISELKAKYEKQAADKNKIVIILKQILQKNNTLGNENIALVKENEVLRQYLSQALQGNLQVIIREEQVAGSTQIVSELVQLPLNNSENVSGQNYIPETVNNIKTQMLPITNSSNAVSLPHQSSQQCSPSFPKSILAPVAASHMVQTPATPFSSMDLHSDQPVKIIISTCGKQGSSQATSSGSSDPLTMSMITSGIGALPGF